MIRINVFVKAEVENYAAAVATARLLAEYSQKESGCIAYDVFQSVTRGDVFMICETWENEKALEAHKQSEMYAKSVAKLSEIAMLKVELFNF